MRDDIFTEFGNNLIRHIETSGSTPWQKRKFYAQKAINLQGNYFSGLNDINLFICAEKHGWDYPIYATAKQWKENGCQIKKGEQSTSVVYSKRMYANPQDAKASLKTEKTDSHSLPVWERRAFPIFNISQVSGNYALEKIEEYKKNIPSLDLENLQNQISDKNENSAYFYSIQDKKVLTDKIINYEKTIKNHLADQYYGDKKNLIGELSTALILKNNSYIPLNDLQNQYNLDYFIESIKKDPKVLFSFSIIAEKLSRDIQNDNLMVEKKGPYKQSKNNYNVENLRKLPLIETMHRLGYDPYYVHNLKAEFRMENGTKISVTDGAAQDGSGLFASWNKPDIKGAGAIDLVKCIKECDTHEAIKTLAELHGENPIIEPRKNTHYKSVKLAEHLPPINHNPQHVTTAIRYLTETRKLDPEIIKKLIDSGKIQIVESDPITGKNGTYKLPNIAFLMTDKSGDLSGAIIRGVGEGNSFKQNKKIKDTDCTFNFGCDLVKAKNVVICESPIDTISYAQLNGGIKDDTHYCTYGGARVNRAENLDLPKEAKMTIAFDSDNAGKKMAEKLKEVFPTAKIELPKNKDFNQDLVASMVKSRGIGL